MFSSHIPRSPRATKLSIEDINSRIECITKVINTMSNDDRAYYNARIRSIELKKQKMLTLAAFAQTQSMQRVLAEMDVLVAENDLIIEIESIRRAKKFKSSEKRILSGSTKTMEDLDETLVIEAISSGSSTPIKKDSTSITKEKQSFSVTKLDTAHDIITLRAQETLQNVPMLTNSMVEKQTDKENVQVNTNVVNKPPSCHVEEKVCSNTEKINSEITMLQTEQNFSDIPIKEIPPQESQQIIENQIEVTQPICFETTRTFESVKENTLPVHVPHPETNKSIEFTSSQKDTPSTPKIPKERKNKLSLKEKSRLFKAPKVIKITEKMCKSNASLLASPTTPELTIGKHRMETNMTNEVPTKQVNAGISVGGSIGGINAKTDANQTEKLPDVTKSHKTVVNLCKTFEEIYSPEATVTLEPQIVKDLPTITISNVNHAFSKSSDKSCKPDGPTIRDIDALNISISKTKLIAQESFANDSKMPHSSPSVAKNTKKSHDSLEGLSNKDKIPHKEISTKKAKSSHGLLEKKDMNSESLETYTDKHKNPHDLTHSSAQKEKVSSSCSEVPITKINSSHGSSEAPSNNYKLYRIALSPSEVSKRKTNNSRGSSEAYLNKYRMYGIPSASSEVPIRKTENSPESAEASSKKRRVSHDYKEITTKKDKKLQGYTDTLEKKIRKHEYSETYTNKDKKTHKRIESTKKDKMSPSLSETSTRKTKRLRDSLELSTHVTKKNHQIEEVSHKTGKNDYYSSSKSSPLNKKSSHNSDYTAKREGKILTTKESNSPITYSEIVTRKFDNIINDEKAIFHMNQLVKLAIEKNGENLN